MDRLFGPLKIRPRKTNRQRPDRQRPKAERKRNRSQSSASSGNRSRPKKQEAPKVQKLENARKILVVGDFMAKSLSDGLETAFELSPGVVVQQKTNGSSGIVRDDYFDWNANLPGYLDEIEPAIVVVMIGSNDRQNIRRSGAKSMDLRSDEWTAEYTQRIEKMVAAVRSRNLPLIWVGAPPYRKSSMAADMLAFNALYRAAAEEATGEYVDIWDGFVNADGKFVFTGSDIKGQQVRLRTSDGIRLTKAGRRKLAFYVEKPIRRLLGDDASEHVATLTEDSLPELMVLDPETGALLVRTVPISMTDPTLDGSDELLGASEPPESLTRTPRDELVVDGKFSEAPTGRADNFTWPRKPKVAKPETDREKVAAEVQLLN
ncbi:MAG: DUF459 domain-containing protein [Pseudomonadota bacterium]